MYTSIELEVQLEMDHVNHCECIDITRESRPITIDIPAVASTLLAACHFRGAALQ